MNFTYRSVDINLPTQYTKTYTCDRDLVANEWQPPIDLAIDNSLSAPFQRVEHVSNISKCLTDTMATEETVQIEQSQRNLIG